MNGHPYMEPQFLPFDFYRCLGMRVAGDPASINQICNACRRREPGHPTRQRYLQPDVHEGVCMHRIGPK